MILKVQLRQVQILWRQMRSQPFILCGQCMSVLRLDIFLKHSVIQTVKPTDHTVGGQKVTSCSDSKLDYV